VNSRYFFLSIWAICLISGCGNDTSTPDSFVASDATTKHDTLSDAGSVGPTDVDNEAPDTDQADENLSRDLDTGTTQNGDGASMSCFANADCPDNMRCEGSGTGLMGVCVTGDRGTKNTGEPCTDENECAGGICIARNDGQALCSQPCDQNMPCPESLVCIEIPFTGPNSWCVEDN
jgi:hypothetical protein